MVGVELSLIMEFAQARRWGESGRVQGFGLRSALHQDRAQQGECKLSAIVERAHAIKIGQVGIGAPIQKFSGHGGAG